MGIGLGHGDYVILTRLAAGPAFFSPGHFLLSSGSDKKLEERRTNETACSLPFTTSSPAVRCLVLQGIAPSRPTPSSQLQPRCSSVRRPCLVHCSRSSTVPDTFPDTSLLDPHHRDLFSFRPFRPVRQSRLSHLSIPTPLSFPSHPALSLSRGAGSFEAP